MFKNLYYRLLISRSGLFDRKYYLSRYPDVRKADINPLIHFIKYGWKEERNPSRLFITSYYLSMYPDVELSGINPLIHYIKFGKKEGRNPFEPSEESVFYVNNTKNGDFSPKVSVIVPNFNHRDYLIQRLDSIYNQTYKNLEVILLDDCSTDGSEKILSDYYEKYDDRTVLSINSNNSGGVFFQWAKGLSLATGELIWIAESDDFCDEDFLEKLIPYFVDESIMLCYAKSIFVDQDGRKIEFTYEDYLSRVDLYSWRQSYIRTAHEEVNSALAIINTIPNASAVLFRKPDSNFELLSDQSWLKMKVCGDWVFYLQILLGGRIAYSIETCNYFRFHGKNSSSRVHNQDVYYQEHEMVACRVANSYKIDFSSIIKNYEIVRNYFLNIMPGNELNEFKRLYNLERVKNCQSQKLPNVLMVIFGFLVGGGEIVPINLANQLREKGVPVTVLNFGYGEQNDGVRQMLDSHIPVINFTPDKSIKKIVHEFGIECIHTHHAYMEYLVAKTKEKEDLNIAHVSTMHGMYETINDDNQIRFINNYVDYWCYIAEKNILPFKQLGIFDPDRFEKIYNGLPEKKVYPFNREEYNIPREAFIFCLASRGLVEKGWYESIEAITLARKRTDKDLHLLLIGDGDVYDDLKLKVLPEYVHLIGFKKNVMDFFAGSDVGLLPSYFPGESVPLVIIENMFCAKPVIATDIGEINEMITDENGNKSGILIELKNNRVDVFDLAQAMVKISSNEDLYKAYCEVTYKTKHKFDIIPISDQYIEIYKKAIEFYK